MPIGPNELEKMLEINSEEERANIESLIKPIDEAIGKNLLLMGETIKKYGMVRITIREEDIRILTDGNIDEVKKKLVLAGIKTNQADRGEVLANEIGEMYERKGWEVVSVKCFYGYVPSKTKSLHYRCICIIELGKKDVEINKKGYYKSLGQLFSSSP